METRVLGDVIQDLGQDLSRGKIETMGRKPSAKVDNSTSVPPPVRLRTKAPVMALGLIVLALIIGIFAYFNDAAPADAQQAASSAPPFPDRGPIAADLKPHLQENLPPLQFPSYPTARPPEVVGAAYKFAAEHQEILSYVPCFCGCERSGHRGNEDCFVKTRDVNGDVVQWDEHGMECAVCIDLATRSLQLHTSGAKVGDIRAAIEKEFGSLATTRTPTPPVPQNR